MLFARKRLSLMATFVVLSMVYLATRLTPRYTARVSDAVSRESAAIIQAEQITSTFRQRTQPRIVFYNRVPKCGSRSLLSVIEKLAIRNNFTKYTSLDYKNFRPSPSNLSAIVDEIANLHAPAIYDRHLFFTDFRQYGYEQPIYINMVRDPVEWHVSSYNYLKYGDAVKVRNEEEWPDLEECVISQSRDCLKHGKRNLQTWFCGTDRVCVTDPSTAVEIAKRNIDHEFLFVGLAEEFENSLKILERMLPDFFSGASEVWQRDQGQKAQTATIKRDVLSEQGRKILREQVLTHAYMIYNHVKDNFDRLKLKYGI